MVVESLDRLRVCEARVMDNMESGHPALGGPGNVFYFVADLAAATAWYSARLGTAPVTRAPQLAMFEVSGTRLTVHVGRRVQPARAFRDGPVLDCLRCRRDSAGVE